MRCWDAQVKVLPWVRQLWGDAHHGQGRSSCAVGWGHAVSPCRMLPAWEVDAEVSPTAICSGITAAPGLVLVGGRTGGARAGAALLRLCQGSCARAGSCRYRQLWVCAPQAVLQLLLNTEAENPRAGFCLGVLQPHRAGRKLWSEGLPLPLLNAALIQL